MDHDTVHERLRRAALELDDRPGAAAEHGARELIGKLDALQAELERLAGGLEAAAGRLGAARPDGPAR